MRHSIQRSLAALLVAGTAALTFAATEARAMGGANSVDACIGIISGCAPHGTGYVLGNPNAYLYEGYDHTLQPSPSHHDDQGGHRNGY
jgi:hypothetical protein